MNWWEKRKHILAREQFRLSKEWPDNDFQFFTKNEFLWLSGTIPLPLEEGKLDFKFELRYPKNYPFSLPYIYPKGREKNWVGNHQFISKAFCLDIREKTWNSSLSAVDIIRSLEKLLLAALDIVLSRTDKLEVYEQEEPTKLDRVRKGIKCVVPYPYQLDSSATSGEFSFHQPLDFNDSRVIVMPVGKLDVELLKSEYFKIWFLYFLSQKKGTWIKASLGQLETLVFKADGKSFSEFLSEERLLSIDDYKKFIETNEGKYFLFFVEGKGILLAQRSNDEDKIEYYGCYNQDLSLIQARVPEIYKTNLITEKWVAIVGCGSGGSYVAEELVKAGITKLVLIDNDYLTVENISRHACDLRDIGLKKVHAVRNKLQKINPRIEVECLENTIEVIETDVAEKIAKCQLLINATATAEEVINEFCWLHKIPSIHSKVYPLGFGGEIIRIIPHVTPCFECTHYELSNVLKEHPGFSDFPSQEITNYNQTPEGEILPTQSLSVDSKFISLFVSKMSLEILHSVNQDEFKYKNNVILWGNNRQWIFSQEFECIKVDTSNFSSFHNCVVCFGETQIESEIGVAEADIFKLVESIDIRNDQD